MAHIRCLVSVAFPLLLAKQTRSPWLPVRPWLSSHNCTFISFPSDLAATASSLSGFASYFLYFHFSRIFFQIIFPETHGKLTDSAASNPYMFIKWGLCVSTLPNIWPGVFSIMLCVPWHWMLNHQLRISYRCNSVTFSKTLEKNAEELFWISHSILDSLHVFFFLHKITNSFHFHFQNSQKTIVNELIYSRLLIRGLYTLWISPLIVVHTLLI